MSRSRSEELSFLFLDLKSGAEVEAKIEFRDNPMAGKVLAALLSNTKRKKDGSYPHTFKSRFDVRDKDSYESLRDA